MDLRGIKEFLRDTSKYILIVILMLFIVICVASFQQVIGPSMTPTLKEDSYILVNKFKYKFKNIKRNDIIILKHDEKYLIKRVIGLPGETIEYKDNIMYIDGVPYSENFLKDGVKTDDYNTGVIGENMYFVLGDNRENSYDGNDFGLISINDIIGKAALVVWPFNEIKIIK